MINSNKIIVGLTVVAILGFTGFAFAHGGNGYGSSNMGYERHMGMGSGNHMGYGRNMMSGDYGRYSSLTDKQIERLEIARKDFSNTTNDLQEKMYQKRLELRSELAKQDTDINKAKNIQKELSGLEAKFDQKQLEHELETNEIVPESNRGFADRGFGSGAGNNCW
jgi:Spy/CpxP family protein refolding chaperone